ncbi:MAG: hypothetical protein M1812_004929 [Candelaria pacifica]|nr:MAG: hypothetical protein M1812_004929 [Candelaria pacifica]
MAALATKILYERLLPLISGSASAKTPLDAYSVISATAMDFITAYLFGLPNSTNFFKDEANRDEWMRLYQSRKVQNFWTGEIPTLRRVLATIGVKVVPTWADKANTEIEAFGMRMCDAADKAIAREQRSGGEDTNDGDEPVVFNQMKMAMEKETRKADGAHKASNQASQRMEVASEMLDHLVAAGFDTTGTTLTYLFWELCRNRDIQSELRHELKALSPTLAFPTPTPNLPPPKDLESLPFLQACIMETLRIHPALPGAQPRIIPPNATIGPYDGIPANVRVSAQAYSLHRNAEAFPEPEEWRPHRWLDEDGSEKHRWFWAFGSGGRMCIGSNFAMYGTFSPNPYEIPRAGSYFRLEMKLVIAAVYTNFCSEIVDDRGIEQEDGYTGGPRGGRLILRFSHAAT